ncbi:Rec8 like protein-domain-containing protein [Mycena pura]|uniref:Rec8 like protein-domain-containing protein n=1 Tax=Mycena pura TaxID=153505 RepID=A0AAD7E2V6_9AGAR|nr:Rec8 like protein-domain-containing protein [Mycena pura]
MFFSPELLAKRDSGFGLLWLAATLGSKSAFKKLPKRSVLTADISQLCDLIVTPSEPLALRLSSNLMIGVARVYKVKQEIFMTDVSNCVASLKKVIKEMPSILSVDTQLQMAQPTARPSALNIVKDPGAAYLMDFHALVADWDEFLNIEDQNLPEEDCDDGAFDPKSKSKKAPRKNKASQPAEDARATDMYTLREHHDHLFSNSFDFSFNTNAGMDPSSSQVGGSFAFDDIFLSASDGLDVGEGLGDDLAKELGEGWGIYTDHAKDTGLDILGNYDGGIPMDVDFIAPFDVDPTEMIPRSESILPSTPRKRKASSGQDKENIPPSILRGTNSALPSALSPAMSFSRLFLSQDMDQPQLPLHDVTANGHNQTNRRIVKKVKKTRLLLDARTELTDDELKTARAEYLKAQAILRRGIDQRKAEKDSGKILEDLVWGAPRGVEAETLVEFWQENFKVQVEARTGALAIHPVDEPLAKRRKIGNLLDTDEVPHGSRINMNEELINQDFNMLDDFDVELGGDQIDGGEQISSHRRSSEEPGQGRHISRPPSVLGSQFDIEPQLPNSVSQRSSLFPWDNAGGGPSSADGFGPIGSDQISIERADIRMRGSSLSRRESSLILSQGGSAADGLEIGFAKSSQIVGEDYAFDVDQQLDNSAIDSQRSDMNLITLERNSFNFLEYVKMQLQGLPSSVSDLSFDAVVPRTTSTRHVAAAAFYHCLVLATKDLLSLKQEEAYGILCIAI